MLNSTHDFSIVQQTLDSFEATVKHDRDRSRCSDRIWKFLEKASSFALRFSEIVKMLLPQSPEYTVTYGIVVLLLQVCHPRTFGTLTLTTYALQGSSRQE